MVPTPCRVRRKLSFERADSQKTLAMGSSTESLGSVEKKAVRLNREKTVDKLSPKTPSTTSMGSTEKTPDTSQSSPVQTVLPSSKTPKGKTAKVKMEIRSAKKPTTAAERTRQHLANAKKERLKRLQKFSKPTRVSNAPTKNKCPKSAAKEHENTDAAESNKKDATPKGAPRRLIRLKPLATTPPSKKAKKDETAEDHPVAPEPDKAKQDVDDNEVDETQATEEKHRKAHAMYMKYWRSIKSIWVANILFRPIPIQFDFKFCRSSVLFPILVAGNLRQELPKGGQEAGQKVPMVSSPQ